MFPFSWPRLDNLKLDVLHLFYTTSRRFTEDSSTPIDLAQHRVAKVLGDGRYWRSMRSMVSSLSTNSSAMRSSMPTLASARISSTSVTTSGSRRPYFFASSSALWYRAGSKTSLMLKLLPLRIFSTLSLAPRSSRAHASASCWAVCAWSSGRMF